MTADEFARLVGGRIAKDSETGAMRAIRKINGGRIPTFKNKDERIVFYRQYIAALYFFELEGIEPDQIVPELMESFWMIFDMGREVFNNFLDDEIEDEDDGGE